jgi:CheY-like chemotaxis protein
MDQPFLKTILLSEDIHRALSRTDCFLNRSGFRVATGRSGEEILDVAAIEGPDVLLIDYDLPGVRGDQVCRRLRGSFPGRKPPILIVGPAHPHEIATRCRDAGCDEYLESTTNSNALLQRLAESLGIEFRLHARFPTVISISFGRVISESLGYTKDISEGGILVETATKIAQGRSLNLRLSLEDQVEPLVTRAVALRVEATPETIRYLVGMRFQPEDPAFSVRLRSYIGSRSRPTGV